jgi:hypothetical protein
VRPALDQLVELLLEFETVPGTDVAALLEPELALAY